MSQPVCIAVDGRTASGKTTLADEVTAELRSSGRTTIHISLDGYSPPRAEHYQRGRLSAEGYLDDARDWQAIRQLQRAHVVVGNNDLDSPGMPNPVDLGGIYGRSGWGRAFSAKMCCLLPFECKCA
jgi:hypothetical protein